MHCEPRAWSLTRSHRLNGERRGQGVHDEEWLALAGDREWAVPMKDDSVH